MHYDVMIASHFCVQYMSDIFHLVKARKRWSEVNHHQRVWTFLIFQFVNKIPDVCKRRFALQPNTDVSAPVVHGCREGNGKGKQTTRRPDAAEDSTPDVSVPVVGGSGRRKEDDMQYTLRPDAVDEGAVAVSTRVCRGRPDKGEHIFCSVCNANVM